MNFQHLSEACLSEINARDGIYLDSLTQEGSSLSFSGEVNGSLCSLRTREWIRYTITFFEVTAYDCRSIDSCEWDLVSNFGMTASSAWLEEVRDGPTQKEFLLATYDFIYRISAARFVLSEVSRRPFGSASP
jgi:hypothetical protein